MERTHPRDMGSSSSASAAAAAARAAITAPRDAAAMDSTSSFLSGLLRRGARIGRRCVSNEQVDTCEKPALSTGATLGIMVAAGVVAFVIILGILFMLHLRRRRRDEAEFANDHHEAADYGLEDIPVKKGGGGSSSLHPAPIQQNRLSAQQLMEAQNPFEAGTELADTDKASSKGGSRSPPRYPDAVKM